MKKVQFKCEGKGDLATLLLKFADKGPFHNLLQLVSNSWDALAKKTWISYDPAQDMLSIMDDGEGMTKEIGGPEFFWYGESSKKREKVRGGRKMMGDRGIAVIAIAAMCKDLHFETIRDGRKLVVDRDFRNGLTMNEIVDGEEYVVDPTTKSRTLIQMMNLSFQPGDEFNEKYLKRWIPWKRPILRDFKIYVNDEELLARSVKNCRMKIPLKKEGPHMGNISGYIDITGSPAPEAGIYVYVNGECIGNTVDYYKWDNLSMELRKRMVVTVDADGLKKSEGADRYAFIKGDRGYGQLKRYLKKEIVNAVRIYNQESQHSRAITITSKMPELLRRVTEKISIGAVDGYRDLAGGDRKKGRIFRPQTSFAEMEKSKPGEYVDGNIIVNSNNPSIKVTSNSSQLTLKGNIAESMVLILAAKGATSVQNLFERRARIWDHINGERELEPRQIRPELVYSLDTLAQLSGRTVGELKYFAATELFPYTEEGVHGANYLKFSKSIFGFTSLYSLIAEKKLPTDIPMYMERYGNVIGGAGEGATKHLIKNLSQTKECYALASLCQESVFGILGGLVNNQGGEKIKDAFKSFKSRMLSVPDIALECEGIDERQVARVIEYAGKQNLYIGFSREKGGMIYNFGDFVRAHLYRLNKTASKFSVS